MDHLLKNIENLRERVLATTRLLDIEGKRQAHSALREEMSGADFWNDQTRAVEASQRAEELSKEIASWDNLQQELDDLKAMLADSQQEEDESVVPMIEEQLKSCEQRFAELEFFVMMNGPYDAGNAIISIHAGTGGVDAQDWAEILERMFVRFAEKKRWKIEVIDRTAGQEAGLKSSTLQIRGRYAYGNLKSESGVHRLVRISPFDAEAMRHTSFALVEVIPELPESAAIEIKDSEISIDVYRSSGPGGQSVNTTDSAVRIRHIPSGIVVTCQNERSQHQNKERAMNILKAKLFQLELERREAEERKLKGEAQKAEWGKQIRSYVMQPYKLVKDHRTQHETQEIDKVLDGELSGFVEAYLKYSINN